MLVFIAPVTEELAAFADRLGWAVGVVDPDRARLDADPVPYARSFLSVDAAALDAGCDVVVCDPNRGELDDVVTALVRGPARWIGLLGSPLPQGIPADPRLHGAVGLDLGAVTPAEVALSTVAALLADRNGRPVGPAAPRAQPTPT